MLAPYPAEMAEYALHVFVMALTMPELAVSPLAVALIIGIAGSLLLTRLRRGHGERSTAERPDIADRDTVAGR